MDILLVRLHKFLLSDFEALEIIVTVAFMSHDILSRTFLKTVGTQQKCQEQHLKSVSTGRFTYDVHNLDESFVT